MGRRSPTGRWPFRHCPADACSPPPTTPAAAGCCARLTGAARGLPAVSVGAVLEAGDKAPSFSLTDQDGKKVRLADFKGRKVLLYFYPKADTPGCTTQACGLRDVSDDVGDTAILGVSPDPPSRQAKFDQKYGLGFPLLAD